MDIRSIIVLILTVFSLQSFAQEGTSMSDAGESGECDAHEMTEPDGERSLDDKINDWFSPYSNAFAGFIFKSINLGADIRYDWNNELRDGDFYNDPPFLVEFDECPGSNRGVTYSLQYNGDERYCLSYSYTDEDGVVHDISKSYRLGEKVVERNFEFTIVANPDSNYALEPGEMYQFRVENINLIIVVIFLILAAAFFTLTFKFVNIRKFKLAIDVVRGKYTDPKESGEVSHFQALTAALSGTVGLGNIAGVAVAISIGGPGATFWMIIAGLLGMSTKFVECTLGVKYREIDKNGVVLGGPMYYLTKGFQEKGWKTVGKVLAVFFALMCIGGSFGGGNMFQINQAVQQIQGMTGGEESFIVGYKWLIGLIVAIFVGVVIIGGIKRIGTWTEKIVPFMVGVYVVAAIFIILSHFAHIPAAFGDIISGAFNPTAIGGGIVGVLIQGFKRAAFSNEAGVGSASIAHSAVKTDNPASEGIVALLEPFIDTVVVCTMTALVIIITGNAYQYGGAEGVELTSTAFTSVIPWFDIVLTIAVVLFAFSTMLSWSYYGLQSWKFVFGTSTISAYTYKFIFLAYIVIGSTLTLGSVIDFSDAMIFAMAVPNLLGLFILAPVVKKELNTYLGKIKNGEIIRNS